MVNFLDNFESEGPKKIFSHLRRFLIVIDTQISHTDFNDTLQVLHMWKHDEESHDINTDHSLRHHDDDSSSG